nr:AraC family ligand binding domain-containing protein [uncultured Acetatifactor sp.]
MVKDLFRSSAYSPSHDIQLIQIGQQDCMPGHSFGPDSRDFYLLHFVTKGHGQFRMADRQYALQQKELFFIPPHLPASYQADANDPWSYLWIGLNGIILPKLLAEAGLSPDNPVLCFSQNLLDLLEQVSLSAERNGFDSLQTLGYLYLFLHQLTLCGNLQQITPPDRMSTWKLP